MRERKMAEAQKSRKIADKSRKIAEAYRSWRQALENMRAALAMNPLVTEPFRTSTQAFDSVGRVLFGAEGQAPLRQTRHVRSAAAASRTRGKVKARSRRRKRSARK